MKVLLINGSPHPHGNTADALSYLAQALETNGLETETLWIGTKPVQGCIGCYKCAELGRCVFTDELYEHTRAAIAGADAIIIGSPTYYAGPAGSLCALLDRVFYSCGDLLRGKPAAAVAIARRGGATTTFDRLNKYFEIMGMPMPNAQYWNLVYGRRPGDALLDAEGLQTLRDLAANMAWLLNAMAASPTPFPKREPWTPTHFIRPDLTPTD